MKDKLKLVLMVSGGEWKQECKCYRQGTDKHLARNLQNSDSHLFCFARKTFLLRAHRDSQLPFDCSEVKWGEEKYIFRYPDFSLHLYNLSILFTFPPIPCVHKSIGVHLCSEFFPNYRAQGTYKLSVLLVKYNRCNQNP